MTEQPATSAGPPVDGEPRPGSAGPLADLWAVQQADTRLAEARARRAALDDGGRLRAETEGARAAADDAAARLGRAQAALRDRELRLATTEAKQKKAEGDLYGGRIAHPKELANLQDEIASLARARDHLEDEILALLDQVEALTQEAARTRAAHRALEERLSAHVAECEAARRALDAEVAALTAERARLASRVEPRLLRKYESIATQESGVGIVAIRAGFCGGCGNTVPPQFVSRVRGGQVVTCERCRRILYLDGAA